MVYKGEYDVYSTFISFGNKNDSSTVMSDGVIFGVWLDGPWLGKCYISSISNLYITRYKKSF